MDTAELQTGSRDREAIMKSRAFTCVLSLFLLVACVSVRGEETQATIIYDDHATKISTAIEDAGQLWITTVDLKRATNFELKPQGVCRNELCFPVPTARQQEFVRKSAGKTWFNIVAFAGLVHQPVAHEEALATWYFGLRSDQRQGLSSLRAPDFTLPDLNGKTHSLSDFRGKKVLLLTWASW
jgi:AhpC/TSA family